MLIQSNIIEETRKFLKFYLGVTIYSHYIAEGKCLSDIVDVCLKTSGEDFKSFTIGQTLINNKITYGTYFPCDEIETVFP